MKYSQSYLIPLISLMDAFHLEKASRNTFFHISQALNWLKQAQDADKSNGGVAEGYHLLHGWLPPYPETTGYIIETFCDIYKIYKNQEYMERAVRMADWLMKIQNADGSIPDSYFRKKMVFDTGQVIFGYVRMYEETGQEAYLSSAVKAGEWLVGNQKPDGTWDKYAVDHIPHTYYARVAWSLIELYKATKDRKFYDACVSNIDWALGKQGRNGWFDEASFNLNNHHKPFTHTIAYTIRGILEVGLYLNSQRYIDACKLAANGLVEKIDDDGRVSGIFRHDWAGTNKFSCLTGSAQLSIILLKLYIRTSDDRFLKSALKINAYLKMKQELRIKNKNIYGAIAGSFPIWGQYIHFNYPNWAVKFFIDALLLEKKISDNE